MPRQNRLLGLMKEHDIDGKEMCKILAEKYDLTVGTTVLSAILNGSRSESPQGQKVINCLDDYFKDDT